MVRTKQNTAGDFSDILAALDKRVSEEPSPATAHKASETPAEIESESRPKNRLQRLLENISFPWLSNIGRFGPRAVGSYTQDENVEAALREPTLELTGSETSKSEPVKPEVAKTEDEEIAEELGLSANLAAAELQRIRRDFAKKNHPDRFEPAHRTGAARRMSIANMLIDAQLRQGRSRR
jgi:hypothetical protein